MAIILKCKCGNVLGACESAVELELPCPVCKSVVLVNAAPGRTSVKLGRLTEERQELYARTLGPRPAVAITDSDVRQLMRHERDVDARACGPYAR